MKKPAHLPTPRSARGFTLIELLVGLVIGLIATIVIAQVLVISEGRRRTTVSGSDAQVSGALSMYALQRELQMAGYGLTSSTAGLGCPIRAQFGGTNYNTLTLAPAVITQGGGGAPDSVLIMTSAKPSYSVPVRVTTDHPQAGTSFFVNTNLGVAVGDLMIAVPPAYDVNNWCSVFNVTSLTGATQINHVSGVGGPWNPAASIFPAAGYLNTSFLVNLGPFATREIGINLQGTNNTLQVRITNSASPAPPTFEDLYPNIVNMKAMYAKDTNGDGAVDTYDNVTPTTAAGWQQVKGIRLAIVARSEQMEKDNVTAAQPLWDLGTSGTSITVPAAAACGTSNCVTLIVNTLPNWQQYRYKVYDTFVPLRNLLWQS